ncbi:MAG: hypothetical protein CMJ25_25430 [Phycisphaerae bacterium]|nr:hypothetical protein [Phycisphaerae bacterium]|tara:strand:+ start:1729 stop:2067 length:339 start_codon:yes stop_codon:yes gene_type:complete
MKNEENKMEDIKKREVTNIELVWDNQEDLFNLAARPEFKDFVIEECLSAIVSSLKNGDDKAELFNVFNMSIILEIKKLQFKPILRKINKHFITNEEYERCNELKKLITKYEL